MYTNEMKIEFSSKSENEGFARTTVAVFLTQLDPTLEELADIKTVVSEAVTNSIIHGYENKEGKVIVEVRIEDRDITIKITDYGVGIEDIIKAREPFYTSKPELERSGMGFAFMETFMDELDVQSSVGAGTVVTMKKHMEQRK